MPTALICFDLRLPLNRMRLFAKSKEQQTRARFSIVFPVNMKRVHFYEKELSESSDERYLFIFLAVTMVYSLSRREESSKHKLSDCLLACVSALH